LGIHARLGGRVLVGLCKERLELHALVHIDIVVLVKDHRIDELLIVGTKIVLLCLAQLSIVVPRVHSDGLHGTTKPDCEW